MNSIFISPSKRSGPNPNRMVKLREKMLNAWNVSISEHEISSFSNTYRSSTIPCEMHMTVTSVCSNNSSNKENKIPESGDCKCWEKSEGVDSPRQVWFENSASQKSTKKELVNGLCEETVLRDASNYFERNLAEHYKNFIQDSVFSKQPKSYSLQKQSPQIKNMINLENILLIERKLTEINEGISMMEGISELCEDWWELSHEETMLQNLGNVFKEPKFKSILKISSLVEVAAISLCYWVSLHLETPPKSILISKLENA